MPYLGAPFVEEGDPQGLFDAIDIVVEKHPHYLLHGGDRFAHSESVAKAERLIYLKSWSSTRIRTRSNSSCTRPSPGNKRRRWLPASEARFNFAKYAA